MPDRIVLQLRTAFASNTGGPYTATWDRIVSPVTGSVRSAWAAAQSVTSNAIQSTVDLYRQADAPAAGSNTATSILTGPITIVNDNDAVQGSISEAGVRINAGDQLQLRTNTNNAGAKPAFLNLTASVEVERD